MPWTTAGRRRRATLTRRAIRLAKLHNELRRVTLGLQSELPSLKPAAIEDRVGVARRRGWTWAEQYIAACLLAAPLLKPSPWDGNERKDFAKRSIRRLELALTSTDSNFIAGRRDWLISEDPDLDALRDTSLFKDFETMYLPAAQRTAARPEDVQKLEMSRYVRLLLQETARRWEDVWHGRAAQAAGGTLDTPTWTALLADESQAWASVERVARDYRHWLVRLDLIRRMAGWAAQYGFQPFEVRVPHYAEQALTEDPELAAAESTPDVSPGRFTALLRDVRAGAASLLTQGVSGPNGGGEIVAPKSSPENVDTRAASEMERGKQCLREVREACQRQRSQLTPRAPGSNVAATCHSQAELWRALRRSLEQCRGDLFTNQLGDHAGRRARLLRLV
jgi:hypothetical protein